MSIGGDGALRFSHCVLPDYPLADQLRPAAGRMIPALT
jgi:hypothetical protein